MTAEISTAQQKSITSTQRVFDAVRDLRELDQTATRETVAEYASMGKAERDNVKDIGGFVGGYLKNGRRSNAGVVNRCAVDEFPGEFARAMDEQIKKGWA